MSAPPTNAGPVFFRAGPSEESHFLPGEYHAWVRVALDRVEVRSDTPGDLLTLVGGTW